MRSKLICALAVVPIAALGVACDEGRCVRNSDCPSGMTCSVGACVLAPVEGGVPDGGGAVDGGGDAQVDGGSGRDAGSADGGRMDGGEPDAGPDAAGDAGSGDAGAESTDGGLDAG